ncbi:MAG: mannose-1-phosphate guanylyltransferase/mannose-6-phosphate isomerase [Gammaproteobacteria bacterium]|nr:mannose-1-phosphate guanylyltransferase/mannose-6-phosphate isomerase [Gammaproteobacteria bacterium]
MSVIYPILLCGGSGTRLWPLSRKSYPKQFSVTWGDHSLFQQSALRMAGRDFHPPTIVTAEDFRFVVSEQLREIQLDKGKVLVEPSAKNTAPAILAAALRIQKDDPEALLLVAPSDQVIPDVDAFQQCVKQGVESAVAGKLVTFGIEPSRPETGYGYLKVRGGEGVRDLEAFVEKPSAPEAERMLRQGGYFWNAGIFLFKASALVGAFTQYAPQMLKGVQAALEAAQDDLDFTRLDKDQWQMVESDSIDYAIMERADNLVVVPFASAWSDLGDWQAMHREMSGDENGLVTQGAATAIDCKNSLIRAESDSQQVVGIGLENTLVVAMHDAVLVADASRAQEVKQAVAILQDSGVKQSTDFPRDNRPWGWYETLALSDRFQVKRIVVKPGGCLSLQSHVHRSEHWIVVAGTARVTIDEEVRLVTENESVYIPLGAVHRMENPGKLPMVLIEVQTGTYLGEDDIVRYEDIYART